MSSKTLFKIMANREERWNPIPNIIGTDEDAQLMGWVGEQVEQYLGRYQDLVERI